jgi:hypothetical protein
VAADYAYILPALAVMLLVIGYPIYDTVYLSFFSTPPQLAMSRKTFVGFDNHAYPRQRRLPQRHVEHVPLDVLLHDHFIRAGLLRGARAES